MLYRAHCVSFSITVCTNIKLNASYSGKCTSSVQSSPSLNFLFRHAQNENDPTLKGNPKLPWRIIHVCAQRVLARYYP